MALFALRGAWFYTYLAENMGMVTANTKRTVKDMGKYVQMDLSYGILGGLTILATGAILSSDDMNFGPGDTFGGRSFAAGAGALAVGTGLFLAANASSEPRGDWLAAGSLGAFAAAAMWIVGFEVTMPDDVDASILNTGTSSSSTKRLSAGRSTRPARPTTTPARAHVASTGGSAQTYR